MIDIENTKIVCIDIQQKLVNMLENGDFIAKNVQKIMQMAKILNFDVIVSEQYPKGLGDTIDLIKEIKDFKTVEKTSFSALKTQEFLEAFQLNKKENILIFGIETHICVYQTVCDLLQMGYNVYVVKDCCASRSKENFEVSLELMKQKGAFVTTFEIVLFELLKTSKHPNFKELQALIK